MSKHLFKNGMCDIKSTRWLKYSKCSDLLYCCPSPFPLRVKHVARAVLETESWLMLVFKCRSNHFTPRQIREILERLTLDWLLGCRSGGRVGGGYDRGWVFGARELLLTDEWHWTGVSVLSDFRFTKEVRKLCACCAEYGMHLLDQTLKVKKNLTFNRHSFIVSHNYYNYCKTSIEVKR